MTKVLAPLGTRAHGLSLTVWLGGLLAGFVPPLAEGLQAHCHSFFSDWHDAPCIYARAL